MEADLVFFSGKTTNRSVSVTFTKLTASWVFTVKYASEREEKREGEREERKKQKNKKRCLEE